MSKERTFDHQIKEFLAEANEQLFILENTLLDIESQGESFSKKLINDAFRSVHMIKGNSGFLGLINIQSLCHAIENAFGKMRLGEMSPNPEVMNAILAGLDLLKKYLKDVHSSDKISCQSIVESINSLISPSSKINKTDFKKTKTVKDSSIFFEINWEEIKALNRKGFFVYQLHFSLCQDIQEENIVFSTFIKQLSDCGDIIKTRFEAEHIQSVSDCFPADLEWICIFATVLEKQHLQNYFHISDHKIIEVKPLETICGQQGNKNHDQVASNSLKTENGLRDEIKEESVNLEEKFSSNVAQTSIFNDTIRVQIDLLNKMMNSAEELVLSRNQLLCILENQKKQNSVLDTVLKHFDVVTSNLQADIVQMRMQTIANLFLKIPRLVRDIAQKLEKKIELSVLGMEVELDRTIIEALSDTITHIIRNCCDHGIETPAERIAQGKPETGLITVSAHHESGQVVLTIEDDGRGIQVEKVEKKALSLGLVSQEEVNAMNYQDKLKMIFLPGMSTAEKVQDLSGRGVGMDIALVNIERLAGSIEINSTKDKGTQFLIRLPLTLAIISCLIVRVSSFRFAIPQVNLVELVTVIAKDIKKRVSLVGSAPVLRLRENLLPLLRLADILDIPLYYKDDKEGEIKTDRRKKIHDRRQEQNFEVQENRRKNQEDRRKKSQKDLHVVVVRYGCSQYGIIVDALLDIEEVVVKPLSSFIKNCKCFAGSAIMGDGKIAMILDPHGIANYCQLSFNEMQEKHHQKKSREECEDIRLFLLFNNHPQECFAIPIDAIARIEAFDFSTIEQIGSKRFAKYRGHSLPLILLEEHLPVRSLPKDLKQGYLIIPKERYGTGGLLASSILDTTKTEIVIEKESIEHPVIEGTSILQDKVITFLKAEKLYYNSSQRKEEN